MNCLLKLRNRPKAKNNYILEITFENNETKTFDVRPYLDFGIFTELKDKHYFRQVKPFLGSIAWPHGQDICPDTLYIDGKLEFCTIMYKLLLQTGASEVEFKPRSAVGWVET